MNDRIHAWLDGELPFEALTPEERERARAMESVVRRVSDAMDRPAPDLSDRVMSALPAGAPRQRWTRRLARSVASFIPRGAALRPAVGLGALTLIIGFGLGVWSEQDGSPTAESAVAASPEAEVYVRFELRTTTSASDVHLAGSFTEWGPRYEMTPAGENRWTVTVPLKAGVHDYVFIVDGTEYVLDPDAPRVADGFGGFNNRIALLPSSI